MVLRGNPRGLHESFSEREGMHFDMLWTIADRARSKVKLLSPDIEFVRDVIPVELESFPRLTLPKSIRHPAGFSVSGAEK